MSWTTASVCVQDIDTDERHIVNANVRFDYPGADGKGTYVMLWSKNLLDESYRIEGLPFQTFANQPHVFGEPRTMGVTVGMNF